MSFTYTIQDYELKLFLWRKTNDNCISYVSDVHTINYSPPFSFDTQYLKDKMYEDFFIQYNTNKILNKIINKYCYESLEIQLKSLEIQLQDILETYINYLINEHYVKYYGL